MGLNDNGRSDAVALVLDGAVGPAVVATRSLGAAGFRVLAPVGTRAGASRFCHEAVGLPPADRAPEAFVDALHGLLARRQIDLLVPPSDAVLHLLLADAALRERPWLAGAPPCVEVALDKARTLAAAAAAGFPTPRWHAPATTADGLAAAAALGFPCCVKPRRSVRLQDGRLRTLRHRFVRDQAEARLALDELADGDGAPPLVQDIVPGRAIAVAAVVHAGRVLTYTAVEEVTAFPLAGGTSVRRRTLPPDTAGVEAALRLLVDLGYEGLGEVEYQLADDGRPHLMELNARLFAHVGLAVQAGVDLPVIGARTALGLPVEPVAGYAVGAERRWLGGDVLRLTAAVSRGPLPPGMRRGDVLRSAWPPWKPGMRYDELHLRDLRPYLPGALRRRPAAAADAAARTRYAEIDGDAALALTTALDSELHARYSRLGSLVRPLRVLRGGRERRSLAAYGECRPPGGVFVIASLDGRDAACGGLRRLEDGVAELKAMFVQPWARGRGLSRLLVGQLEAEARRLGYHTIRLETGQRQPEAQALYASCGFHRIPNYGRFADRPASRCFEKQLDAVNGAGADDAAEQLAQPRETSTPPA